MDAHSIFIFVLGLIFGSFFNVVIYRMPEDKSLGGRSHCRHCKKLIPWFFNIPILGFLYLRARTACCGKRLSWQYPLVELTTGLLFLCLYHAFGLTWTFAAYAVFTSSLIVISVIDFHHQIIPDELSLSGIVLGFGSIFITQNISWSSSLLGILLGGGTFYAIAFTYEWFTGREGLGGGDVKLLAMLGAWLGVHSILIIVVLSTFLGSLVGIALIAFGQKDSKGAIPFGPFLAIAALIFLFFQDELLPQFYPLIYP